MLGKEVRIITVEELDIVVQASVEQALTEFKRLSPEIKKEIKKITTEFNNADIKNIKANINMTQVTKEIKKVKGLIKETFNPNEVNFTVNGMKEIKGISTEFSKLSGKKIDLNNQYLIVIVVPVYSDYLTMHLPNYLKLNIQFAMKKEPQHISIYARALV